MSTLFRIVYGDFHDAMVKLSSWNREQTACKNLKPVSSFLQKHLPLPGLAGASKLSYLEDGTK